MNHSPEPVTIATVKATCGCTVFDAPSYKDVGLPVGGEFALKGTLDVGSGLGEHRKRIDLLLTDGSMHAVFVKYVAFNTYDFKPKHVQFGEVNLDDETDDALATVIFSSASASIIEQPATDSPWLEAAVRDRGTGEAEIVVHIVKRNLPHGKNVGRVAVTTDDPTRPTFSVPVYAEGVADLRPVPAQVFLRRGSQQVVRVINKAGEVAAIVSAKPHASEVQAEIAINGTTLTVGVAEGSTIKQSYVWVTVSDGRKCRVNVCVVD